LKREYVEAARACGSGDFTILFGEVLPHVVSATVVYSMTVIGPLIVIASGLSFLGLGIQPPTPEWGLMVSKGKSVLYKAPHLSTLPGLMIVLLTISINLAGDALSDTLDPRRRLTR
jgi:peptide/nickel transport system permease protein